MCAPRDVCELRRNPPLEFRLLTVTLTFGREKFSIWPQTAVRYIEKIYRFSLEMARASPPIILRYDTHGSNCNRRKRRPPRPSLPSASSSRNEPYFPSDRQRRRFFQHACELANISLYIIGNVYLGNATTATPATPRFSCTTIVTNCNDQSSFLLAQCRYTPGRVFTNRPPNMKPLRTIHSRISDSIISPIIRLKDFYFFFY